MSGVANGAFDFLAGILNGVFGIAYNSSRSLRNDLHVGTKAFARAKYQYPPYEDPEKFAAVINRYNSIKGGRNSWHKRSSDYYNTGGGRPDSKREMKEVMFLKDDLDLLGIPYTTPMLYAATGMYKKIQQDMYNAWTQAHGAKWAFRKRESMVATEGEYWGLRFL